MLESEGLLRRNASLPLPAVALHVGLIASPGTEGYNDFLGQLTGSGLGFRSPSSRSPSRAPARRRPSPGRSESLGRSDCDVIAMVRGGGARADLAAFETEVVARAVAGASKPVFTGIGHTGDETVADIVAARACITPTECGHQIVVAARQWWADHVAQPAETLARRVPAFLGDAEARDAQARRHLTAAARAAPATARRPSGREGGLTRAYRAGPSRRRARLPSAPMPPGWGPWPSVISDARTSG